jgi:hypothetical protein
VSDGTERDRYDIEKRVYETQWANIRHHWTQTFAGTTFLSTLIALAIVPVQLLRSDVIGSGGGSVDTYVKAFVAVVILLLGIVTFLNQYNHYMRSREARRVVVAIERQWGLYDEDGHFVFQDAETKYAYAKFAGGEKRLTYSMVQFAYIVVISVAGLLFVVFA